MPPDDGSPRVAVVVPCYNDGAYVGGAVSSVQENEPIEVVVVDDGSTAAPTLDQLAALETEGVRVIRRENGGLGAARCTGLAATSAPLVYPLDADDRLVPGALAAMADALDRHPGAGFAWGHYSLFGTYEGFYRSPRQWLPWTLTYVDPYPVCSMFRRTVLERAGGWRGRAYEDWDLWLTLVELDIEGVHVDRVVYRRQLHGDSRLLTEARRRHRDLYDELRRTHAALFARRVELRRRERPAPWKRMVYPILFGERRYVPFAIEAFLQRTMMRLGSGLP